MAVRGLAADRCPGVLALHPAEDGSLARIRVPGGRLVAEQLRGVAAAAALGNGLVELTSRGNVQVRGLPASAGGGVATLLASAGLLPSFAHDRVRNVVASPLAGRLGASLLFTDGVVEALDQGLCADPGLTELPGRFLFAVDDGSRLALGQAADVALAAVSGEAFALELAGRRTTARVAVDDAAALALHAARAFLEVRDDEWRIAQLPDGPRQIADHLGLHLKGDSPSLGSATIGPGVIAQSNSHSAGANLNGDSPSLGSAVTAMAPLGRLDRETVVALAELVPELRLSPWRTLTVCDVPAARVRSLAAQMEDLGLVTAADSGWTRLSACPGLGACAKARIDVRAAAGRRARERDAGAPVEHWSACERRCGEPRDVQVSVTATEHGVAVVADGRAHTARSVDAALVEAGA